MLQLIDFFLTQNWTISFGTTAAKNENSIDLTSLGVREFSLELNNSSFDDFLQELNPTIVLFDRFMTEEQFGWRVSEACPNALRILDTEDLHCLRKTRQQAIQKHIDFHHDQLLSSEIAKREIASIYRCDVSLIISSFEMQLLQKVFHINKSLLYHLPFLFDPVDLKTQKNWKSFQERHHFMSIGNFLHAPNLDATLQLKKVIWPLIRKQLPKAELHVYGAYPSQHVLQMHNAQEGFFVYGFVENAQAVFEEHRVLLAPLRFGAGIKGKLTDAMLYGTPSVTTFIGAEGMHDDLPWNGYITSEVDKFVEKAVELYQDETLWNTAQENGAEIINQLYVKSDRENRLLKHIQDTFKTIESHRANNFIGQMLQHHTMKSYKYLGKWIEEKNKRQPG
jgi:glycosyltransferase involved in cell wall biosynthesis